MPRKISLIFFCLLLFGCSKREKFQGDFVTPIISSIVVSDISGSRATVNWQTNEPAKTILHYGVFATYGLKEMNFAPLTRQHEVTLTQLTVNTTYHFVVGPLMAMATVA